MIKKKTKRRLKSLQNTFHCSTSRRNVYPESYNFYGLAIDTLSALVRVLVDIVLLFFQVDNALNEADLEEAMSNEFLRNSLITAGWLQPLTLANKHRAMQTLIVFDVLEKRKAPMDQFIKGLKTLGVHSMITSYPELMRAHFVNSTGPLSSADLIDNLSFTDTAENQMAKNFLIQSIKELENGMFIWFLFWNENIMYTYIVHNKISVLCRMWFKEAG